MSIERFVSCLALPLVVLVPLGGAFLAAALGQFWGRAGRFMAVVTTTLAVALGLLLMAANVQGTVWAGGWNPLDPAWKGPEAPVFDRIFGIAICTDGLTTLMLVLIAVVSLLVVVYSLGYMPQYTAENRFFALFLLMVAGMNGCVITGDLFNFFVFLEVASIASYALVGFGTESEELEAAFKYLVLGTVASSFVLFGIALTWGAFGTLNFADLAGKLRAIGGLGASPIMLLAAALFVLGLGLKAAMVPFHAWLPDAHPSAPAPISAMLSGLLIKALGVYALARIFIQVLGAYRVESLAWVVVALGALSMVVGVLLAVGQWDFKRLLAYHSISQMGYVVLALGLAMVFMGSLARADRLKAALTRRSAEELELRMDVSRWRPVLDGIKDGMLDPETAGAQGPEALRQQVEREEHLLRRVTRERDALRQELAGIEPRRLRLAVALALLGAIFHLVNHAFFKSLLFLCAGAFERATGTRNLKELGGLWQKMPVTSASCAVAALSISGVPPLNGFWSKLLIILAAALGGQWLLTAVTVAVSFATLISFVKVQKYALFGPMSARVLREAREVAPSMRFAMLALAAGCILLGVFCWWVVPNVIGPAATALGKGVGGWTELLRALGVV